MSQQSGPGVASGEGVHSRTWFALQVKSRYEKLVADTLEQKGYAHLLPLYESKRRWSDRVKVLHLPLFAGYVFCCFDPAERQQVLQTVGVRNIVMFGARPAEVTRHDIIALTRLVESHASAEPIPYVHAGQLVRICKGPLTGVTGFLREIKNSRRLVISIDLLQRSVAVDIDETAVVPFDSEPRHILSWHRAPSQQVVDLLEIPEQEVQ